MEYAVKVDNPWMAEEDARALARAVEVLANEKRHADAKIAAGYLVSEQEKRNEGMKRVAGFSVKKENIMESLNKQLKAEIAFMTRKR